MGKPAPWHGMVVAGASHCSLLNALMGFVSMWRQLSNACLAAKTAHAVKARAKDWKCMCKSLPRAPAQLHKADHRVVHAKLTCHLAPILHSTKKVGLLEGRTRLRVACQFICWKPPWTPQRCAPWPRRIPTEDPARIQSPQKVRPLRGGGEGNRTLYQRPRGTTNPAGKQQKKNGASRSCSPKKKKRPPLASASCSHASALFSQKPTPMLHPTTVGSHVEIASETPVQPNGCGSKISTPNGTLVSGNMDQHLRSISWWFNFDPYLHASSPMVERSKHQLAWDAAGSPGGSAIPVRLGPSDQDPFEFRWTVHKQVLTIWFVQVLLPIASSPITHLFVAPMITHDPVTLPYSIMYQSTIKHILLIGTSHVQIVTGPRTKSAQSKNQDVSLQENRSGLSALAAVAAASPKSLPARFPTIGDLGNTRRKYRIRPLPLQKAVAESSATPPQARANQRREQGAVVKTYDTVTRGKKILKEIRNPTGDGEKPLTTRRPSAKGTAQIRSA